MIRFIDIKTGNTYNGNKPYVHYFDDQQSVNMFYVKQICFVSKYEQVNVKLPGNQSVFRLANLTSLSNETKEINKKAERFKGFDLVPLDSKFDRNKKDTPLLVEAKDGYYMLTLNGYASKYGYMFMLYVVGSSPEAGEFHEDLTIQEVASGDTAVVEVSADFTPGDEAMIEGIHNYGAEIPERIQEAIYETDIREDATDAVLMNRKWKELLINYINILNNKGNYKSLENSIGWFEYGGKIKLHEYWHKDECTYEKLLRKELVKIADDEVKDLLHKLWKTTYISLSIPINEYRDTSFGWDKYENEHDLGGELRAESLGAKTTLLPAYVDRLIEKPYDEEYDRQTTIGQGRYDFKIENWEEPGVEPTEDNVGANLWRNKPIKSALLKEPIPELFLISFKWSKDILMLKAALVSMYFEKYFLPIHMDCIYGSIEELIYTNVIKFTYDNMSQRSDVISSFNTFKCNINNGDIMYIDNISVASDESIPFSNVLIADEDVKSNKDRIIGAVNFDDWDDSALSIDTIDDAFIYEGVGTLVPVECTFECDDNLVINYAQINILTDSSAISTSDDNGKRVITSKRADWNPNTALNGKTTIKFNIVLFEPGNIKLSLLFYTNSHIQFSKVIDFELRDAVTPHLKFNKVTKIPYNTLLLQINNEQRTLDSNYKFVNSLLDTNELPRTNNINNFMWASTMTSAVDRYIVLSIHSDSSANDTISTNWYKIKSSEYTVTLPSMSLLKIGEVFSQCYKDASYIGNEFKKWFNDALYKKLSEVQKPESSNRIDASTSAAVKWMTENISEVAISGVNAIVVKNSSTSSPYIHDDISKYSNNPMFYSNVFFSVKVTIYSDGKMEITTSLPFKDTENISEMTTKTVKIEDPIIREISNTNKTSVCTIASNDSGRWEDVGLSHVVIIPDSDTDFKFSSKPVSSNVAANSITTFNPTRDDISTLIKRCPHYWWICTEDNGVKRYAGIRKYCNISDDAMYLVNQQNSIKRALNNESNDYIKYYLKYNDVMSDYKLSVMFDGVCSGEIEKLDAYIVVDGEKFEYLTREGNRCVFVLDSIDTKFMLKDMLESELFVEYTDRSTGVKFKRSHKFELRNITPEIMFGSDDYKETFSSQANSEDRFFPLVHRLTLMNEMVVNKGELVSIQPTLSYSTHKADVIQWKFYNITRSKQYVPSNVIGEHIHSIMSPFLVSNDGALLTSGIYDIELNIAMGGNTIKYVYENAIQVNS